MTAKDNPTRKPDTDRRRVDETRRSLREEAEAFETDEGSGEASGRAPDAREIESEAAQLAARRAIPTRQT